jgi:hypothetical protein
LHTPWVTRSNGHIDKEELRMLLESTESGAAVMFTEHWLPDDELDRVMEQYDVVSSTRGEGQWAGSGCRSAWGGA